MAWLLPTGIAIGLIGSLAGVGGGLLATPLLQHFLKLPLKTAAATSLVLVFATTASATLVELFEAELQLFWWVAWPTILGVLCGAQIGFRVAQRIRTRPLQVVFVVFLVLSAVRLFFGGGPAAEALESELVLSRQAQILVALVGLAGGFLAPILGIGGGLIMVPGLLLVLPPLGFAGARAGSLAAGAFASLRALTLHARAARVCWPFGLRLGLGALIGAAMGVRVVHLPGLREVGRPLIGAILVFAALRFLRDLLRSEELPARKPQEIPTRE
ncbi:MAG: putative membrane protein YfcA [Planctomycetota bacterium]|jgi:uncharacterized membrane protein YfcA